MKQTKTYIKITVRWEMTAGYIRANVLEALAASNHRIFEQDKACSCKPVSITL